MPVVSLRLFVNTARTRSPSTTRSWGPVHTPLKPSAARGSLWPSIRCSMSSMVSSKTLTSPSRVGSRIAFGAGSSSYSAARNRSTLVLATTSCSDQPAGTATADALGAGEPAVGLGAADAPWSMDGAALADGVPVDGTGAGASPVGRGAYDQAGPPALGVQAT